MEIAGICFDIGGTLVNGGQGFCARAAEAVGMPQSLLQPLLDANFLCARGSRAAAIYSFCQALGLRDADTFSAKLCAVDTRRPELFADVLPTLRQLCAYRLAVLSNATPWDIADLDQLGLADHLACVIYSFEIGHVKPSLQAFRAIERQLNITASQMLMVGDSLSADIQGARAAGWNAIYLRRHTIADPAPPAAQATISTLAQLPEVLCRLEAT